MGDEGPPTAGLWHAGLSLVGLLNLVLLARLGAAVDRRCRHQRALFRCSLVYTLVCTWRSVLPAIYVQRTTWTTSWANAALVQRLLAASAEFCGPLCLMPALVAWRALPDTRAGRLGRGCAAATVVLCLCAEPLDTFSTVSTNEWYGLVVSYLWSAMGACLGVTGVCLFLASARRHDGYAPLETPAAGGHRPGGKGPGERVGEDLSGRCGAGAFPHTRAVADIRQQKHAAVFGCALAVFAAGYVPYMLQVDAPMYRARWRADEAAHKTYFGLRDGARDAFLTRNVTHEWAAWRADALWETLYFSLSVWGSMLTVFFKPGA